MTNFATRGESEISRRGVFDRRLCGCCVTSPGFCLNLFPFEDSFVFRVDKAAERRRRSVDHPSLVRRPSVLPRTFSCCAHLLAAFSPFHRLINVAPSLLVSPRLPSAVSLSVRRSVTSWCFLIAFVGGLWRLISAQMPISPAAWPN